MVANMGEKKDYSLPVRIAMLVWLVRNGHTAWMFKSGAWVAILMNSKTPSKGKDLFDNEAACDYVSKYSQPRRNGQVVSRFRDHPQWSPLSK